MDNRPIGIFDSGLGGLTAVQALRELLPDEDIIYFGDTARNPYGTKSPAQLRVMARQDMELVASRGAKAIIAACGTVSSTAHDVLSAFAVPVFNVVDPAVQTMAKKDGPLGIIATAASIENGALKKKLAALCPDRLIVDRPCQDFVRLIEAGKTSPEDEEVMAAVSSSMAPLKDAGVRAVLLGCTHFGYLGDAIRAFMGKDVRLVSASHCAAECLANYLVENSLTGGHGREEYYTSGDADSFCAHGSALLGRDLSGKVFHLPPMEVNI